jgi:hypothetical protein
MKTITLSLCIFSLLATEASISSQATCKFEGNATFRLLLAPTNKTAADQTMIVYELVSPMSLQGLFPWADAENILRDLCSGYEFKAGWVAQNCREDLLRQFSDFAYEVCAGMQIPETFSSASPIGSGIHTRDQTPEARISLSCSPLLLHVDRKKSQNPAIIPLYFEDTGAILDWHMERYHGSMACFAIASR